MYSIIAFTAIAMGVRNAAVRKLGVADLTTTVLTLTITGLAADSSLAGGGNPRWQRRLGSVLAMFAGAASGAILAKHSVFTALALALMMVSVCGALLLFAKEMGFAKIERPKWVSIETTTPPKVMAFEVIRV